ncbi:MAG: tetratricopeptide repeat protein [Burkholderiales bacterium]
MSFFSRLTSKVVERGAHADPKAELAAGNAQLSAGQIEEAIASYRRALSTATVLPEARFNLGVALQSRQQFEEAAECFRSVIGLAPRYAPAYLNLGNALRELGRPGEALDAYRNAAQCDPRSATAQVNLGNALKESGRADEALTCYENARQIDPQFPDLEFNIANAYKDLGRFDQAAESYRRALEQDPRNYDALTNLGNLLRRLGAVEQAADLHRQAIAIDPRRFEAHDNLGGALSAVGDFAGAIAAYREALVRQPRLWHTHSNLQFTMNYAGLFGHKHRLEQARLFGSQLEKAVPATPLQHRWDRPQRLRVGMISGDLRSHPVGYFLEGLVSHLDSRNVELFAYPTHDIPDEFTERLRKGFVAWKPLTGMSDDAAANLIRADRPHIVLDLSGHTARNRLPVFARRVAPVQATWLGYFGTTGVTTMDFIIGDPYVTPPDEEDHFTERVLRLPETYLCFSPPDVDHEVGALPALAIGAVTFGCFNSIAKINDRVVELWSRVLATTPGARLFLKCPQLHESAVLERTRARFAAHGIPESSLILEGPAPREELLAAYHRVDLALDPFPYPGGTTTAEALWMGVPTLTRRGENFLSHVGESIAHNVGLDDWIADDDEDYVAKATRFASDRLALQRLRGALRARALSSPLFDAPRFAKHFEAALWQMWERQRASSTP